MLFAIIIMWGYVLGCSGGVANARCEGICLTGINPALNQALGSPLPAQLMKKPEQSPGISQEGKLQAATNAPAVYQGKPGWARTWGGISDSIDTGKSVAVDILGNVYVTGGFYGKVAFDTSKNTGKKAARVRAIEAVGEADCFLSKFDANGEFQWAKTWGAYATDYGNDVACDSGGNVYVTGYFYGNVDFDPDPNKSDMHQSNGDKDIFLSKFDKDGNHLWTRTWGGPSEDEADSVAAKGLNEICVTGFFRSGGNNTPVDFDPGAGFDKHISAGKEDAFVTMFNSEGDHLGVKTWGGADDDCGYGVAIDKGGNIYVAGGYFSEGLDFSCGQLPGGWRKGFGGGCDAYLSKFSPSMDFMWAQSWGALGHDYCSSVTVDRDGEYVYVTGIFWQTVDFSARQRGVAPAERTAQGECDAFVSQFKSNGIFDWVRTFDGAESEWGSGVAVTRDGYIYVTGCFEGNTEFTPGGASHSFISAGDSDAFLTKFDKNGGYIWTRVIGGIARDNGLGVTADPIGGAYVVGYFGGEVDFAPTGADIHKARGLADIFLCSFPPDGNWTAKIEISPEMKVFVKKSAGKQ